MNTLYNKLGDILEQLLKDTKHRIEPSPRNTDPLFLLLTVKPHLAGFVALDGQPEENFSKALKIFKDLYSIHSANWTDFDLGLVLCKTDTEKATDEFCNEIEMDPYFCRKFVIDLNKDVKGELARLPFIPLRPESIVGLKRPISAQTFLMKHGLSSLLAKYLVVPHARGIERIVEECLDGVLGKPTWLKAEIKEFPLPRYQIGPKVRLKGLEINNFRCYRENNEFDLDADLIVLFGPNGFGKTSFLDAIDFVCTGGVARFDERFRGKTHRLLNTLRHLDSPMGDCFVKATTLIDGKEVRIERRMTTRTQAYIKGVPKNRTKILMGLAGLSEEPPDLRIENLVRLFRATHLFGQEYQFLTSEFREYSRLPEDTVSRMLAFQDYVEATNKARRVSEKLRTQIKEKESRIAFLRDSLESKKVEMEKLRQSAGIVEKPETVLKMGKEIGEKITHQTNIPIETPNEFSQGIIHDWRAMITVQIGSVSQNLGTIRKLEAEFPECAIHKKELRQKSLESAQKKELQGELNKHYSEKKKKLKETSEKLGRMLLEERNLSGKRENLRWLLPSRIEYEQVKTQITKEDKNYRSIQAKMLEVLPKIEELRSKNIAAEETIGRTTAEIKILESSLEELSDLDKSVDDWQKTASRHREAQLYLQKFKQKLANVISQLQIKRANLNAAIVTQDKVKKRVDNLQQFQSELRTLLDNIERHILDNICPVCGTSHKSREELTEKLKFRRGIQPNQIREVLKSLEQIRVRTDRLKKQIGDLQIALKECGQKLEERQKVFLDTEEKMKTYRERAISLDIPTDSEDLTMVIDSKKKKVLKQMDVKQQELSRQKFKVKKQEGELAVLLRCRGSLEQNVRTTESKQSQLRSMMGRITSGALTRRVSLETGKNVIQRELSSTRNIIEDVRKQIEMRQAETQNLRREVSSLVEKKNILNDQIQELDKGILDSKKYIEELESLVKRLNLNLDIDMGDILALRRDCVQKLSSLDSLQDEITNFEIALDASQISAALAKSQRETENTKKEHQDIKKNCRRLCVWLWYFDVIRKELESLQNQALGEYTEKYGPLTSTVQKRLRPVYGFGDVELTPEKGGIAVRVKRKGERNLHPSDYFSESQIQVVMLSLFLSAALTQTWSSFAPILLDDPVEHFDDLNAYSLLDLIRGLIMESGGARQFIISTCEDRLFQLMRQKFSKINRRVIFYVFESIGEDGPKIKRL